MPETWIGQYCIYVTDLDATVAFYEALGLTCTSRTEIDTAGEAIIETPGKGGKLQLAQPNEQPDTFDPVTWSGVTAPITYVRASLDRAVPPALQDEMIGHLPPTPTVVDWDCGHIPAVTRPDDFAALLGEFLN